MEQVNYFLYVGVIVENTEKHDTDIRHRINKTKKL